MVFLLFVFIFIVAYKGISELKQHERKIVKLEYELNKLQKHLNKYLHEVEDKKDLIDPIRNVDALKPDESKIRTPTEVIIQEVQKQETKSATEKETLSPPPIPKEIKQSKPAHKEHSQSKNSWWAKIEEQFSKNLTGVLGTIAMIFGVIYLAVYAAIQLPPIGRFGMVTVFSVLFYVLHLILAKKEFWQTISLWTRSASGIIFLVGCLGSVGLESMKWVEDSNIALIVLVIGLGVNLGVGYFSRNQFFASLHVFTSFLCLALIPFNPIVFYMATLIAMTGSLMSYRENIWDKNLIITNLSFCLLNFVWVKNNQFFQIESFLTIILISLVAVCGLLSHYYRLKEQTESYYTSLSSHLVIWATFGLNLYPHSKETLLNVSILTLASITTYFLSKKAKKNSIGWLYTTDKFISLILILLAILSIKQFGISYFDIVVFASVIVLVFLRTISDSADSELDKHVFNLTTASLHLTNLALIILTLRAQSDDLIASFAGSIGLMILNFLMLMISCPVIEKTAKSRNWGFNLHNNEHSSNLGIPLALQGVLILILITTFREKSFYLLIPALMYVFVFNLRKRLMSFSFDIATLSAAFLIFGISWKFLFEISSAPYFHESLLGLMFTMSIIVLLFNWIDELKQKVVWPGIAFIWSTFTIAAYYYTRENLNNLTAVLYLLISLLALGIKDLQTNHLSGPKPHEQFKTFVTWAGLLSIFLFSTSFFLIDIQSEQWIGSIKLRWAIELLFLSVIAFWWGDTRKYEESTTKDFCDYFLELFLVLSFVFSIYEFPQDCLGLIWILSSFIALLGPTLIKELKRLTQYSYLMFLCAILQVAFIATTIRYPFELSWHNSTVALGLSLFYLIAVLKKKLFHIENSKKEILYFGTFLQDNEVKLLLYPFAVCVAAFLNWTYSHSLLSILLITECFAFFVVSLLLREQQFRFVAMGGICIIFYRIIFYDLVGKDFFLKAMVFLSVGATLVAMNIIYNKYKYRFEPANIE